MHIQKSLILIALVLIGAGIFLLAISNSRNNNDIAPTNNITQEVDRVSIPETQMEGFDREGNLVRNSPGMKSNVWYLIYESQGQPALSAELEFNQSSICAEGVANSTCDPSVLTQGMRVRILGEETNQDVIRVIRLEVR